MTQLTTGIICFILGAAFSLGALKVITLIIKGNHYLDEKHFCNYCEMAYVETIEELNYKYCPLCGKELTRHKESIYLNKEK